MTIDRAYSDYHNPDMAKASSGQMTHKGPSAEVVGSLVVSNVSRRRRNYRLHTMGKADGGSSCNRKTGAWISLDIAIVPRIVIQLLNKTPAYAIDKKQKIH